MGMVENFEKILAGGRDSAMLRFSLGSEYLKMGDAARAVPHLRVATTLDSAYSAAWKLLGKALTALDDVPGALEAYRLGMAAAEAGGDKQAAKEMAVFMKRLNASPRRAETP